MTTLDACARKNEKVHSVPDTFYFNLTLSLLISLVFEKSNIYLILKKFK